LLDELVALPLERRPEATRPVGALAGERIRKVYRRMVKMGRAISVSSPPQDLHELRKKGKELRYLLELFATPLYPEQVVRPMVSTLKSLQNLLGRHQDREVQVGTLRALSNEVAALPGGSTALMAIGILVERLDADQLRCRSRFEERFAAFASKSQRRLIEDTFA
jgi:CHAD domain-containing protein